MRCACDFVEIDPEVAGAPNLTTIWLENNQITKVGKNILELSKIHWMQLKGNPITKRVLMNTDGFDAFEKRRQDHVNKGVAAGLSMDTTLCGLDS